MPYKMPVRISKDDTGEVPVPLVANHFCFLCFIFLEVPVPLVADHFCVFLCFILVEVRAPLVANHFFCVFCASYL